MWKKCLRKYIYKNNLLFTVCFLMLFFTEALCFFCLIESECRSAKSNTCFNVERLMFQNDMTKDNGFHG